MGAVGAVVVVLVVVMATMGQSGTGKWRTSVWSLWRWRLQSDGQIDIVTGWAGAGMDACSLIQRESRRATSDIRHQMAFVVAGLLRCRKRVRAKRGHHGIGLPQRERRRHCRPVVVVCAEHRDSPRT